MHYLLHVPSDLECRVAVLAVCRVAHPVDYLPSCRKHCEHACQEKNLRCPRAPAYSAESALLLAARAVPSAPPLSTTAVAAVLKKRSHRLHLPHFLLLKWVVVKYEAKVINTHRRPSGGMRQEVGKSVFVLLILLHLLAIAITLADAQPPSGALILGNLTKSWGKPEYRHCHQPFNWTELIHGYKDKRIKLKSGGLGQLIEDGAHEVWVCVHDHYCGDPWFCFVYHEGTREFTAWGPNSQLDLVKEKNHQDDIDRLWETWSQLKELSETTHEQVRAVGNFLYHVKEEALNEKSKPARRLSVFRGVQDARSATLLQNNRVLVVAPWNKDDENDFPSYNDIVEYVERTRLGATLLTEDEIRANRQALITEGEKWRPAWYGNPSAFYVAIQRPEMMHSCAGCQGNGESGCTCSTNPENFYIVHICSWGHHSCYNVQPLNHLRKDLKYQSLALIAYWSTCSHNCLRF